ncbi:unnamed protein product, partial [Arabidopsis halleri]
TFFQVRYHPTEKIYNLSFKKKNHVIIYLISHRHHSQYWLRHFSQESFLAR